MGYQSTEFFELLTRQGAFLKNISDGVKNSNSEGGLSPSE
jgi:hypothetical protein